ncbi:hypothetical protein BLS_002870 [Venturia inaequalis]|uniref:Uncharacterized protein n=1 Tax=Venturia inaequalis TaxID=5025 RepID=A0A8H3UU78_VENIN|nr:hypothetical protein BLS_002870 [Venturia inaequalis]
MLGRPLQVDIARGQDQPIEPQVEPVRESAGEPSKEAAAHDHRETKARHSFSPINPHGFQPFSGGFATRRMLGRPLQVGIARGQDQPFESPIEPPKEAAHDRREVYDTPPTNPLEGEKDLATKVGSYAKESANEASKDTTQSPVILLSFAEAKDFVEDVTATQTTPDTASQGQYEGGGGRPISPRFLHEVVSASQLIPDSLKYTFPLPPVGENEDGFGINTPTLHSQPEEHESHDIEMLNSPLVDAEDARADTEEEDDSWFGFDLDAMHPHEEPDFQFVETQAYKNNAETKLSERRLWWKDAITRKRIELEAYFIELANPQQARMVAGIMTDIISNWETLVPVDRDPSTHGLILDGQWRQDRVITLPDIFHLLPEQYKWMGIHDENTPKEIRKGDGECWNWISRPLMEWLIIAHPGATYQPSSAFHPLIGSDLDETMDYFAKTETYAEMRLQELQGGKASADDIAFYQFNSPGTIKDIVFIFNPTNAHWTIVHISDVYGARKYTLYNSLANDENPRKGATPNLYRKYIPYVNQMLEIVNNFPIVVSTLLKMLALCCKVASLNIPDGSYSRIRHEKGDHYFLGATPANKPAVPARHQLESLANEHGYWTFDDIDTPADMTIVVTRSSGGNLRGSHHTSEHRFTALTLQQSHHIIFGQSDPAPKELTIPGRPDDSLSSPLKSSMFSIDTGLIRGLFPFFVHLDLSRSSTEAFLGETWQGPGRRTKKGNPPLYEEAWITSCLQRLDETGGANIRILQNDLDGSSTDNLSWPKIISKFGRKNTWSITMAKRKEHDAVAAISTLRGGYCVPFKDETTQKHEQLLQLFNQANNYKIACRVRRAPPKPTILDWQRNAQLAIAPVRFCENCQEQDILPSRWYRGLSTGHALRCAKCWLELGEANAQPSQLEGDIIMTPKKYKGKGKERADYNIDEDLSTKRKTFPPEPTANTKRPKPS